MKKIEFLLGLVLFPFIAFSQLSGTYSVGESGDFSDVNSAVDALNSQGLAGDVIFSIRPGTYETSAFISKLQSNYSVTFQSSTGNADDVVLQDNITSNSQTYVFRIDTSMNLNFFNLTFKATDDDNGTAILLNGIKNLKIDGCKFYGNTNYNNTNAIIYDRNKSPDSNLVFTNNYFVNGAYGIYLLKYSYLYCNNVKASNNEFYNQRLSSLYLNSIKNVWAENNFIHDDENCSAASFSYGLSINYARDTAVVTLNKIILKKKKVGLEFSNSTVLSHIPHVYNNFVYIDAPTNSCVGIQAANGYNANIEYNTVIINGNSTSDVFYFRYSSPNYVIKNNVLVNLGNGWVFRNYDTYNGSTQEDIDSCGYNIVFTSDINNFAKFYGTTYSYDDFKTQFADTFLLQSKVVGTNVLWLKDSLPYVCLLDNSAEPNGFVQTDFWGNKRSLSNPVIGAFEKNLPVKLLKALWTESSVSNTDSLYYDEIIDTNITTSWYLNNDLIAKDTNSVTTFVHNTSYAKLVISKPYCSIKDSILLTVLHPTDISNINKQAKIFPNPVKNFATINSQTPFGRIIVFDISGKLLINRRLPNNVTKTTIDLSTLQRGVYTIKLDNNQTVRFLKQ